MNKVLEIKQMDLYEEMAHICPNQDLKLIKSYSQEEVNQKIQHYETQIAYMSEQELKSAHERDSIEDTYDSESSSQINHPRELINTCKKLNHHSMMDLEVVMSVSDVKMDMPIDNHHYCSESYMEEEEIMCYDRHRVRNIF